MATLNGTPEQPEKPAKNGVEVPAALGADRELIAFVAAPVVEGRRRRVIDPRRIVLTSAILFGIAWLLVPTTDELAFHFSQKPVLELGEAIDLPSGSAVPLGAWVRARGVLGNKAAMFNGIRPGTLRRGPIQLRQILGSSLFVELDQEAHPDLALSAEFPQGTFEGRVADFGPDSEMDVVRAYFIEKLEMQLPDDARIIVIDERPGQMWRYPAALVLGLGAALLSLYFLLRSMRPRVVDGDAMDRWPQAAEGPQ